MKRPARSKGRKGKAKDGPWVPARRSKPGGKGTLLIVGGREDKTGECRILREIAERTKHRKLVVCTSASEVAMEVWDEYERIFKRLGVKDVCHLAVESADRARDPALLPVLKGAQTVFFTGGDQLKLTTRLGGTPLLEMVFGIFETGGLIAGTSAGAAIMGESMLVGSEASDPHKVGNWMMAPGMGFMKDIIIDQHFAQRGRIGRLLHAVALNPGILGIGIDEDTAVIIENGKMEVIGNHAVYVVDGRSVSYTNISEAAADMTFSMHDVTLHILGHSELFDLSERRPQSSQELMRRKEVPGDFNPRKRSRASKGKRRESKAEARA